MRMRLKAQNGISYKPSQQYEMLKRFIIEAQVRHWGRVSLNAHSGSIWIGTVRDIFLEARFLESLLICHNIMAETLCII